MIVAFEIRDEVFENETQIEQMVHLSPFWTICNRWVWHLGTIETNVITTPIPDTEVIDDSIDKSSETNRCDPDPDSGGVPDLRLGSDDEGQPTTPTQHTETQEGTGQDPV